MRTALTIATTSFTTTIILIITTTIIIITITITTIIGIITTTISSYRLPSMPGIRLFTHIPMHVTYSRRGVFPSKAS